MPGKIISPRRRAVILALHNESFTNREIASRVKCDRRTVDRIIKRHLSGESLSPRPKSGRPSLTTPRDNSTMVRMVLRDRRISATSIQAEMSHRGVDLSVRTVRRRLLNAGFRARKPVRKPFLTNRMKTARLNWAREHQSWTLNDWKKVLWSDESRFNLHANDGRRLVRRREGESLHPDCIERTSKHPTSVMVWSCFSWHGVGRFYLCERTVNQDEYLKILQTRAIPSIMDMAATSGLLTENIIFQDDNAPCHRARKVRLKCSYNEN